MKPIIKIKKREFLIYMSLILYTLGRSLYRININIAEQITNQLVLSACILLIFNFIIHNRIVMKKAIITFVLFAGLLFIDFLPTGAHELFYLFTIIWCIHNEDLDKLVKFEFLFIFIMTFLVIILMCIGVIENKYVIQNGIRARYCLGFSSWTILPFQYLALVFGYSLFYKNKVRLWHTIPIEIVGYWIYKETDVKTAFGVLTFYLIGYFIIRKRHIKLLLLKPLLILLPWLLTAGSFLLIKLYEHGHSLLDKLDYYLNWRLRYNSSSVAKFGINMLSRVIVWENHIFVDNAYINLALTWGILGLFFILFIYSYLIYFSIKNDNSILLLILLTTLGMDIFWDRLINFPEVYFILYFAAFFRNKKWIRIFTNSREKLRKPIIMS